MTTSTSSALRALARTHGLRASYENNDGETVWTPPATLIRMLHALNPAFSPAQLEINPERYLEQISSRRYDRTPAPQTWVAWNGTLPDIDLWWSGEIEGVVLSLTFSTNDVDNKRASSPRKRGSFGNESSEDPRLRGDDENGWEAENTISEIPCALKILRTRDGHTRYRLQPDTKKAALSFGYYDAALRINGRETFRGQIISAPLNIRRKDDRKLWGAFAPLYALRRHPDSAIGTYPDLQQAGRAIRKHGGDLIGTLPLLPVFYDRGDISPYSPVSRFFWNEIYLDTAALPFDDEKPETEPENVASSSPSVQDEDALYIDYPKIYTAKKSRISAAAQRFFAARRHEDPKTRYPEFLEEYPLAPRYARFRAEVSSNPDKDAETRFHLYAQYACFMQTRVLSLDAGGAHDQAAELYLDYPVGVHPDGFDAHAFPDLFLQNVNVGAPPDALAASGQDWGFRALHPQKLADQRYVYFRDTLRHYFRFARLVRLDHVMGLYRLYCLPHGIPQTEGAYLMFPFETMLAIVCLEAHLHGATVIGEDLGTVPRTVRKAMDRHGLYRMWIWPFELQTTPGATYRTIPAGAIAALNTHDVFPYRAFIDCLDLEAWRTAGMMSLPALDAALKARQKQLHSWKSRDLKLTDVLAQLGRSPATFVMVNFEDLWGETRPQNMPGTTHQYRNWQKRFLLSIDDWQQNADVAEALSILDRNRKKRGSQ